VGGAKEERYQTSPIPDVVHAGVLLPVGRKLPARLFDSCKDQKMLKAVTQYTIFVSNYICCITADILNYYRDIAVAKMIASRINLWM
jgi:hypothetical protein